MPWLDGTSPLLRNNWRSIICAHYLHVYTCICSAQMCNRCPIDKPDSDFAYQEIILSWNGRRWRDCLPNVFRQALSGSATAYFVCHSFSLVCKWDKLTPHLHGVGSIHSSLEFWDRVAQLDAHLVVQLARKIGHPDCWLINWASSSSTNVQLSNRIWAEHIILYADIQIKEPQAIYMYIHVHACKPTYITKLWLKLQGPCMINKGQIHLVTFFPIPFCIWNVPVPCTACLDEGIVLTCLERV